MRIDVTLREFLFIFTSGKNPEPRYKDNRTWNELYLNTNNDTWPWEFRRDHTLYTELFASISRFEEKNSIPEEQSLFNRVVDLAVVNKSYEKIPNSPFTMDLTIDSDGTTTNAYLKNIQPIMARCDFVLEIYLMPESEDQKE